MLTIPQQTGVQLSLFDLNEFQAPQQRRSVVKYLTQASWDNYIEMALRGLCSLVSTMGMVAITATPIRQPEMRYRINNMMVQRRRQRMFGTNIITADNTTMYINWHRDSSGVIHRDTVVDDSRKKISSKTTELINEIYAVN